jgi:predicted RNA-binding Zn ribbon-like protein
MPVDLGIANAARRAADLTWALLREPFSRDRVVATLVDHGEPEPVTLSDSDLASLRAAALELVEVFRATTLGDAANRLNGLLDAHGAPPRLTAHDGTPWHVHVDSADDAPWAEWFLASSSLALATILAERQSLPGGICAAPDCVHPYVDFGRGVARRYCSDSCATRTRVAALRRRRR